MIVHQQNRKTSGTVVYLHVPPKLPVRVPRTMEASNSGRRYPKFSGTYFTHPACDFAGRTFIKETTMSGRASVLFHLRYRLHERW